MIGDRVRVSAWTATYVGRSSWPTAKENPVLCDALGGRVLQVGCGSVVAREEGGEAEADLRELDAYE